MHQSNLIDNVSAGLVIIVVVFILVFLELGLSVVVIIAILGASIAAIFSELGRNRSRRLGCRKSRFCGAPEERLTVPESTAEAEYPGAIEISDYDTFAKYGHADTSVAEVVPDGNPYDSARTQAPLAASSCADDSANDDELDGDENMADNALSRNDATRATAGSMNRSRELPKYLNEELAMEEGSVWWGRHEY